VSEKPWKRTERKMAARLGGRRVPITGRSRGSTPDVNHEWLAIECKPRQSLPEWLHSAMAQAVASVRGQQLPVVVLHETDQRHQNDYVVIKLSDFAAWFNPRGDPQG
jgi:hypothetical protein